MSKQVGADQLTFAAYGAVVLLGGLNFVAVRFSNRELPPFWGAGIRFATASLLLFALVALLKLALPRRGALIGAFAYGSLAFGASYAFGYWGLVETPAGIASLIMASVPLLTVLLAALHLQEPFRWRGLIGGILAMSGVGIMFAQPVSAAIPLLSLLAVVAMALCAAESVVLIKFFPRAHPVTTNAIGMAAGAALLLMVSAMAGEPRMLPTGATTWGALAYLVVFGSFTMFVLFLFVLKRWTASATSYVFVLFPLVAVSVSAWVDREPLSPGLLAGGVLVLTGVYIGALMRTRPIPEPVAEMP